MYHIQPYTGPSSARPRLHAYDSSNVTQRDLQKMRNQRSFQDDHLLGHHSGGGGAGNIPLHHQRSVPHRVQEQNPGTQQPKVWHGDPSTHHRYDVIPGPSGVSQQQFQPLNYSRFEEIKYYDNLPIDHQQDSQHHQGGRAEVAQDFQAPEPQRLHQQQPQVQSPQQQV